MSEQELVKVKEESREVNHMTSSRLLDSLFSKDLAPHYMKLAGQLAASEIVPKCYRNKPSDLFLCWAKGYQLGIPPEQAMDCISVINGKAVMWGDEMLALCMSHPDFVDIIEEPMINGAGVVTAYSCTIKRKGRSDTLSVFSLDMAKKAGLLAKGGVWNQYPERMLKLRARGFALRDAFPDALKGIKSREEVEDSIDAEYVSSAKPSRTELLKKELTNASNMDVVYGSTAVDEYKVSIETTSEDKECVSEADVGEEKTRLHSEIKRLLDEKQFTDERRSKALAYYEVDSIDALPVEEAQHFIQQLMKL
jgi:hypothetical protein